MTSVITEEATLLESILENESIETWFQPIVSLRRQRTLVVEALTRGRNPDDGSIVPPMELFAEAKELGLEKELDTLCIKKSVTSYLQMREQMIDVMLSINVSACYISSMDSPGELGDFIESFDIDPEKIIIEILEEAVSSEDEIKDFVDHYRGRGYLIGIDDIGSGYSSLLRVAHCRPDVIKIDRGLVTGIDRDHYKREVVASLTSLAHKLGIMVVAEGLETEGEVVECMNLGIDLHQGFFFERPVPPSDYECLKLERIIRDISDVFRANSQFRFSKQRQTCNIYENDLRTVKAELGKAEFRKIEYAMRRLVEKHKRVEMIYLLDENGQQVSGTITRLLENINRHPYIFRASRIGDNMSLKTYFLSLQNTIRGMAESGVSAEECAEYTTEPYISSATGRHCLTFAGRLNTADGMKLILCVDIQCHH